MFLGVVAVVTAVAGCGSTQVKLSVGGGACGVRAHGTRILDRSGRLVYREPGHYVHPNGGPGAQLRCSGQTVWAVWLNGGGMMKEDYIGARSGDAGRSWRLVISEPFFGVKAPHSIDAYLGPWTLRGPEDAYFTGWCAPCSTGKLNGTVSLSVTTDGGVTFRRYAVPALNGYEPTSLRVSGTNVTIRAKGFIDSMWRRKTVTLHVA